MNARRWLAIGLAIAVAAVIAAAAALAGMSGEGVSDTEGPAALPEGEMTATPPGGGESEGEGAREETLTPLEPAAEPRVDPSVSVGDPVPDDVVRALFDKLQAAGATPLMNETYTVEFDGSTDRVRIEGSFEEGDGEYAFLFADDVWTLESGD